MRARVRRYAGTVVYCRYKIDTGRRLAERWRNGLSTGFIRCSPGFNIECRSVARPPTGGSIAVEVVVREMRVKRCGKSQVVFINE